MVFASGASPTEMRTKFAIGCFALLVAGSVPHRAAAAATPLPQAKVEQAVINALPTWHGTRAQIIEYLDFTKSFATTAPWALVVARDAKPPPGDLAMMGNGSPIVICFVKTLTPRCGEARGHAAENGFDMTNGLIDGVVVFAGPGRTRPLLMLQTSYAHGLNGNANIGTKLFEYDRKTDGFRQVFVNITGGSNNNAAARFVEHGPLQGDVIVNYPTDDAPYAYWVEAYAPGKSDHYARILRYRSITRYGDGNPLAVADSEMPEIMERMGLWKPGDALPIPPHAPKGCGPLVMRRGEAWCKTLRIASTPQQ